MSTVGLDELGAVVVTEGEGATTRVGISRCDAEAERRWWGHERTVGCDDGERAGAGACDCGAVVRICLAGGNRMSFLAAPQSLREAGGGRHRACLLRACYVRSETLKGRGLRRGRKGSDVVGTHGKIWAPWQPRAHSLLRRQEMHVSQSCCFQQGRVAFAAVGTCGPGVCACIVCIVCMCVARAWAVVDLSLGSVWSTLA